MVYSNRINKTNLDKTDFKIYKTNPLATSTELYQQTKTKG